MLTPVIRPHIKPHPVFGWQCSAGGAIGFGRTPARAYDSFMTTLARQHIRDRITKYRNENHRAQG